MTGNAYVASLLTVLTVCAVVMAFLSLNASLKLTRALRRTERAMGILQTILQHANRAGRHLETVVHRGCETALGVLDRVERVGHPKRGGR